MDYTSKFLTYIVNSGITPKHSKDIMPADTFKRIAGASDKGGKRSISYWLRIELDFAYGYARDFKTGIECHFNSARDDADMTRADLTRIKAMMKARKAEEDAHIAKRHAKIALRANQIWHSLSSGETTYSRAKAINPVSARVLGDSLWISIIDVDQIVSWQLIKPNGEKRFPFGGKKQSCWHVIGQINPLEPITICEGYATGCSIYAAINTAVVVAFDAGNLLPVAKKLRGIYKNTPIVVAADNDESQTGQKAAASVQKSVTGVTVVMPNKVGYDFNDLEFDAIQLAFGCGGDDSPLKVSQPSSATPAVLNSDWVSNLISDAKGRMVATSLQNAILYMLHHDDFKGVFVYDEFKQSIVLGRCPPWEFEDKFKVANITDINVTQAAATLERYGLTMTIDKTLKAIQVVANENKFHSARKYFESLEWDGVPRLETFLVNNLGCKNESPAYLSFIFKKWMTAAVKRIYEPACKFDHVLILDSDKQGLYKSSALKELVTFDGESYHTDAISISDIGSQYTALKMQGVIVVELAELSGFSKQDDDLIKNWITQTVDEVKLPYDRSVSKFGRQFVFAATTNNNGYLKDPSGNRRYWPAWIDSIIDIAAITAIKKQLWAEAVKYYRDGLYVGPTEAENSLADIERQKRISTDAWDEIVTSIVERLELDEFRSSDILAKMDLRTTDKNEKTLKRISGILKMNGYENKPVWDNKAKKSVRLWSKKDV